MIPGLDQLGLCAMMMGIGASIAARTMLCGRFISAEKSVPRVHKTALRIAVERQRALPKLKRMIPAQIAERVVASIRTTDANLYPITADDLDDEILAWCDAHGVHRPCPSVVREEIAMLSGVRRKRMWLTGSNQVHAYVRARLRVHGKETERPTLYWIDDLPDIPMDGPLDVRLAASNARLSRVQTVQTSVRPALDVRPEVRPQVRRRAA